MMNHKSPKVRHYHAIVREKQQYNMSAYFGHSVQSYEEMRENQSEKQSFLLYFPIESNFLPKPKDWRDERKAKRETELFALFPA